MVTMAGAVSAAVKGHTRHVRDDQCLSEACSEMNRRGLGSCDLRILAQLRHCLHRGTMSRFVLLAVRMPGARAISTACFLQQATPAWGAVRDPGPIPSRCCVAVGSWVRP